MGTVAEERDTVQSMLKAGLHREPGEMDVAEAAAPGPTVKGYKVFTPAWTEQGTPEADASVAAEARSDLVGERPEATTSSQLWPGIRDALWTKVTTTTLELTGTSVSQWQQFIGYLKEAGASVPQMTQHACRMAAAFGDHRDGWFLVRGAACGVGFPYRKEPTDAYYEVENYVADNHEAAMTEEIEKEKAAGNIVLVPPDWWVQGVAALGMVAKLRLGKWKFRPVWDYSRPEEVGVNARIELDKDSFASVKDAFALLRPGLFMAKVDLTAAYRSLPVAAQYWGSHVFKWHGETLADTRAPFGNAAMPGIFSMYTRAIVRFMQSHGANIVGYLDDFLLVGGKEECKEMMLLLIDFVRFLGFDVNLAKCEGPTQLLEFLGIQLSTEGEACTAAVSEERIQTVVEAIRDIRAEDSEGRLRRSRLESLLGVLGFCGQVVYGLSLYTRYAHSLVAATRGSRFIKLTDKVVMDLKVMAMVLRLYNGRKVLLCRQKVKRDWFSTDASTGEGMGGTLDHRYFAVDWQWLLEQRQLPFYPFRKGVPESYTIGYLELFAVWWAVVLWGKHLAGLTVVVRIDNQGVIGQIQKWWGPAPYIPLLRELFLACVKWDIRLQPVYIKSKDNVWADLLSRNQLKEFLQEFARHKRITLQREDRDDWMLLPPLWHALDVDFGPFTLDACVAVDRSNAFCIHSWSKEDDAAVQRFDGHMAWGNLPFSNMLPIVENFLRCKRRQQHGTGCCFLVPCWEDNPAVMLIRELTEVFKVVRVWKAGSSLFTAPALKGGHRTFHGETRFAVMVVHVPRHPVDLSGWADPGGGP